MDVLQTTFINLWCDFGVCVPYSFWMFQWIQERQINPVWRCCIIHHVVYDLLTNCFCLRAIINYTITTSIYNLKALILTVHKLFPNIKPLPKSLFNYATSKHTVAEYVVLICSMVHNGQILAKVLNANNSYNSYDSELSEFEIGSSSFVAWWAHLLCFCFFLDNWNVYFEILLDVQVIEILISSWQLSRYGSTGHCYPQYHRSVVLTSCVELGNMFP